MWDFLSKVWDELGVEAVVVVGVIVVAVFGVRWILSAYNESRRYNDEKTNIVIQQLQDLIKTLNENHAAQILQLHEEITRAQTMHARCEKELRDAINALRKATGEAGSEQT